MARAPRKPKKPKGYQPPGKQGRQYGYAPQYDPNQTQRYQSKSFRYSKAVELAVAGPDFVQIKGDQILQGDYVERMRGAGKSLAPEERYRFRYLSNRATNDYWTVEYSPSSANLWGPGGPYPPIADFPPNLKPGAPATARLRIYAMQDRSQNYIVPGYWYPAGKYVQRNRTSNWANTVSGGSNGCFRNPAYGTPIIFPTQTNSSYPVPFPSSCPNTFNPLPLTTYYVDPFGWHIILFEFHAMIPTYVPSIPPAIPGANYGSYFLAYGRSDLPPPDNTVYLSTLDPLAGQTCYTMLGYYRPNELTKGIWGWQLEYDQRPGIDPADPSTFPPGYNPDGTPGPGAGGGSSVQLEGLTCDCPDFTKTQGPILNSRFNSEQASRDWTSSDAGCDQAYGCKHILATKIFLGLEVEVPDDFPVIL